MLDHYTYRSLGQEHVGLCAEFPSLSCLAASHSEALTGIRALVRGVVEEMGVAASSAVYAVAN